MSRASGSASGFTLIEILIVLALMGLVAGVVWPRLGARTPALDSVAASLARELRTTREAALAGAEVRRVDLAEVQGLLPAGFAVEGAGLPLVFLPNGAASGASFLVRDRSGAVLRVEVDGLTGRVALVGGRP